MSITHPYSTTITPDPEHGDHAISLDGALIGYARTAHEELARFLNRPRPGAGRPSV
jgi:hypothetical protein